MRIDKPSYLRRQVVFEKMRHIQTAVLVKQGLEIRRLEFKEKMIDLLYTYQDVTDSLEMMLFDAYCWEQDPKYFLQSIEKHNQEAAQADKKKGKEAKE